ncbi:MAG TPA: XylR family transcriptional regulator [Tepidisphaeraceae bacterium]|jgi:LacI family transcriptional regulator|nr:XylR family transcriptional regulator [Tepidisphaeraceae bacterium]
MSPNLCVRLYADVANRYSRGVLRGIADFAKVHGGWDFDFDPRTEPIAASTLTRDQVNGDQVNGVLIYLRRHEDGEALVRSGIPAVNVANLLSPPVLVPSVFPDDHAVGAMAAAYFLERGFQSFAYCGSESREYSRGRYEGFGNALKPRTCACVNQDGDDPAHRAQILKTLPRPLAIFCCNDDVARQIVREAIQLGIAVPDEAAVLGVGNDEVYCDLSSIPLSSVRLDTYFIGYEAAAMLRRLMSGESAPLKPMLVPPVEVSTRRSTDVLALADSEVAAAVRFIRDRGGREINVEDLLQRTSLSRRSLEIRFRRAVGRSPYQEIRRVQLERAKLLLSRTDRPVREIADACGFKEARQLSTAFHESVGLTPRQYRRRARGDDEGLGSSATEQG